MKTNSRVKAVCVVLAGMCILALALFRVHRRHQVIRIGYELSEARTKLRSLQEEQNRLRLEESVLTNPGRIESLATALGMIRPTPDQLRIVLDDSSVAMRR
jgi:cell division protein FtsL